MGVVKKIPRERVKPLWPSSLGERDRPGRGPRRLADGTAIRGQNAGFPDLQSATCNWAVPNRPQSPHAPHAFRIWMVRQPEEGERPRKPHRFGPTAIRNPQSTTGAGVPQPVIAVRLIKLRTVRNLNAPRLLQFSDARVALSL